MVVKEGPIDTSRLVLAYLPRNHKIGAFQNWNTCIPNKITNKVHPQKAVTRKSCPLFRSNNHLLKATNYILIWKR